MFRYSLVVWLCIVLTISVVASRFLLYKHLRVLRQDLPTISSLKNQKLFVLLSGLQIDCPNRLIGIKPDWESPKGTRVLLPLAFKYCTFYTPLGSTGWGPDLFAVTCLPCRRQLDLVKVQMTEEQWRCRLSHSGCSGVWHFIYVPISSGFSIHVLLINFLLRFKSFMLYEVYLEYSEWHWLYILEKIRWTAILEMFYTPRKIKKKSFNEVTVNVAVKNKDDFMRTWQRLWHQAI